MKAFEKENFEENINRKQLELMKKSVRNSVFILFTRCVYVLISTKSYLHIFYRCFAMI